MLNVLLFTKDTDLIQKISPIALSIGCNIKTAKIRKDAINYVCNHQVSLCIIELENDGEGFCSALKLIDETVPTIIFSDNYSEEMMLKAFEKGCDDYILKSVSKKEIAFRIQSVLKRTLLSKDSTLIANELDKPVLLGSSTIDFNNRFIQTKENQIPLSKKEASLLKLFYYNSGKLLKREDILREIWNTSDYYASKSMDVYLSKLRKILSYENSVRIQNIHGTGYMFVQEAS
jgi:DNA-binding response OmpR family regulator